MGNASRKLRSIGLSALLSAVLISGVSAPFAFAATETGPNQIDSSTASVLATLTEEQKMFLIEVLQSFGVDETTVAQIQTVLEQ